MIQVVPYSEKYYVYGPNNERLYVYSFSGYETETTLVSRELISETELKETINKIQKDREAFFAKNNIILDRLDAKKISEADADKEFEELEKERPQHWKDILYDKFGLRQLIVDREITIGSLL